MNHLGRNLHTAFARNEDDATPVPLFHRWKVESRQANTAEDVHVKKALPLVVGDLLERLRLEDAQVVHQNFNGRELTHEIGGGCRRGHIAGESNSTAGRQRVEACDGGINRFLRTSVYDDSSTLARERFADREPDARGAPGHEGQLSGQSQIHALTPATSHKSQVTSEAVSGFRCAL